MKKMIIILLFLYGTSIGLPDIAVGFYNTRLRIDDGIMMILFLCVLINGLYHPYRFTKTQLKFLKLTALFAVSCLLSSCVTLILDMPFDYYSLFRMLGCMLILVTLSTILKSPRLFVWLGWGLLFGGSILVLQIIFMYRATEIASMAYSFQLKNALKFETWNANTPAYYAIMLAFIMALMGHEMSGIKKRIFWVASGVFSLIPLFIFARGATAGIGVAWLVFILLSRRNRLAKAVVILLFISMVIYLSTYEEQLIRSSIRINLSTGEGLSDHHINWRRALDSIAKSPLIGHGFGQEMRLGIDAHNAFLSVLVEGGLIGVLLFIWPLGYLGYRFWKFTRGKFYDTRAVICFGFLLGILVASLSQSALYWQKSEMITLSLMVVYLGRVEKSLFYKPACQERSFDFS